MTTTVTATEFKARCLELMDRVYHTRETIIITKRGKPVSRLGPPELARPQTKFLDCLAGECPEFSGEFDRTDHLRAP